MVASSVTAHAVASSDRISLAVKLVGTALGYFVCARLGLLIPYVGSHVSLVWLPTGVAMAAYIRWGKPMAWAVLLAAFAVNAGIGGPAWLALGIALGNALGPWLAVRLLKRLNFDATLLRRRDLAYFLGAVLLGMCVTASNGTTWLYLAGALRPPEWGVAWTTWWIGDSVGALLGGVPLITATASSVRQAFEGRQGGVNLGLVTLVLLCGAVGFSPWLVVSPALMFPLLVLPLFLVVLLAMRAGLLAASLAVLLLSVFAAWGTARGVGPFAGNEGHLGLLALWSYLTALACTNVLICGFTAELLASQRQQATLFHHAEDGILVLNPLAEIKALNPAAGQMLGLTSGPKNVSVNTLPLGPAAALLAGLANGAVTPGLGQSRHHVSLQRAGADAVELEVQATRFVDARGQLMTQLILRDVTERWAAEARLAASEKRLRDLTNNVPALLSEFDADLRFRFANRTYQSWFGLDPAALIGKTIGEVMGAEVESEIRPSALRAMSGELVSYERKSESSGRAIWIRVTLAPRCRTPRGAPIDSGPIDGFYTVASDVTEFKRAEEALRQGEQRLRAITDHLPMRISFVDREGRFQYVNQAYETISGRPRASFYGMHVREVIGPAAYIEVAPRMAGVLAGETQVFDSERTSAEDGYRCYRSTYVPQYGEDGREVLGFVCMVVDTTVQKLEERRLTELTQIDMLTGLLNRVGFERQCLEALQRSRSSKALMALMFLDLDGFKQVNDTQGHLSGDVLLRAFAGRLSKTVRGKDIVARLGGDEFVVIAEGLVHAQDAERVAANLVSAMRDAFVLDTQMVHISTSIGVALYGGEVDVTPSDLLARADKQLYLAKANGRNQFCIATDPFTGTDTLQQVPREQVSVRSVDLSS